MIKVSKQTNIALLIKLILLSLMLCLPKAPVNPEHDNFFSNISKSKVYSFLIPSNAHFEHKVLKKIPLIESSLPATTAYIEVLVTVLDNSTPTYSLSKVAHFISSSFARGPPLLS